MKTTRVSLIVASAVLTIATIQPLSLSAQSDATTTTTDAAKKDAQLLKIASPLEEIVELSKSGVGDAVVVSYIQSSERTYNVGAKDIIALRNQGVSPEVTTALIQRGAEQRQASATAAAEAAKVQKAAEPETVAVAPTYQTQPATTMVAAPTTVTYYEPVRPASTVSVTYIGYPRYSYYSAPCYPSYVTYSPGYCYPRTSFAVGVGFGGYRGGYYGGHYRSSARYCR